MCEPASETAKQAQTGPTRWIVRELSSALFAFSVDFGFAADVDWQRFIELRDDLEHCVVVIAIFGFMHLQKKIPIRK